MQQGDSPLTTLFQPRSIALTGASQRPDDLGTYILRNIVFGGFKGSVFPISSEVSQLYDYDSYPSISSIQKEIDLVIIADNHDVVVEQVMECAQCNVHNICIITNGFSETGSTGRVVERKIVNIARKAGIRLLGPNSLGILLPASNLNATFGPPASKLERAVDDVFSARTAFISQSGALINALAEYSAHYSLELPDLISLGNRADIDESLLLDYYSSLRRDGQPHVVGLYLEGFSDPQKFLEVGSVACRQFPVLILTPHNTREVQEYALSHSGGILQRDEFVDLAIQKVGAMRVSTQTELFDTIRAFAWQPVPRGERLVIVSNAGSGLILALDNLQGTKLQLAEFSSDVKRMLTREIHWRAHKEGVIDLGGAASSLSYLKALDIVLGDSGVHSTLVILSPQGMTEIEESAEVIGRLSKQHGKTIVAAFLGYDHVEQGIKALAKYHIPAFNSVDRAVAVLAHMTSSYHIQKQSQTSSLYSIVPKSLSDEHSVKVTQLVSQNYTAKRSIIDYADTIRLLELYGVSTTDVSFVDTKNTIEESKLLHTYPVELFNDKNQKRVVAYSRAQALDFFDRYFKSTGCFVRKYYAHRKKLHISIAKDTYYEYMPQGFSARELQKLSIGSIIEIRSDCMQKSSPVRQLLPVSRQQIAADIEASRLIDELGIDADEPQRKVLSELSSLAWHVSLIPQDFEQIVGLDLQCVVHNQQISLINARIRLDPLS